MMRDTEKLLLEFAQQNSKIRVVLLNGSRANPLIAEDDYQDYDILFIVEDIDGFKNDDSWHSFLGTPILQQLPDIMTLGNEDNQNRLSFAYLMIFEDGSRIDLTLFPVGKFHSHFKIDSLTQVLLDKDNLFPNSFPSNDSDYHIQKPTEIEFLEVSNEFWWVSTYVVKGLLRKEITYAKEMMETVCRPMFMKMIEWNIGIEHDFSISFGKSGKNIQKLLPTEDYINVLKTYSDANPKANWEALLSMATYFSELQIELASKMNFKLNILETHQGLHYLNKHKPLDL